MSYLLFVLRILGKVCKKIPRRGLAQKITENLEMDYCQKIFTNVTYKFLQYGILCEGWGLSFGFAAGWRSIFFLEFKLEIVKYQ
jgi:hypothetical protein